MSWILFVLLGLATFRLTRLVVYDDITSFIRAPFMEEKEEELEDGSTGVYIIVKGKGIRKFFGELLSCHWCSGIWCAAIIYAGYSLIPIIFYPLIVILALAAVSSIIQTLISDDI